MINPRDLELKDGTTVGDHLSDEFIQHVMQKAEERGYTMGYHDAMHRPMWLAPLIALASIGFGFFLGRLV